MDGRSFSSTKLGWKPLRRGIDPHFYANRQMMKYSLDHRCRCKNICGENTEGFEDGTDEGAD